MDILDQSLDHSLDRIIDGDDEDINADDDVVDHLVMKESFDPKAAVSYGTSFDSSKERIILATSAFMASNRSSSKKREEPSTVSNATSTPTYQNVGHSPSSRQQHSNNYSSDGDGSNRPTSSSSVTYSNSDILSHDGSKESVAS